MLISWPTQCFVGSRVDFRDRQRFEARFVGGLIGKKIARQTDRHDG